MGKSSKKTPPVSAGLFSNFRYDGPASIVVFLVALPLCLGIALASDAPLFAGVITGVVAGTVVGFLSGSELSVSGPAAGLTLIVASGIHSLGSYETFLCAVMLCGVFQFLFGLLRAGFLATLFPNAVIKGMLAAIGITIILKQLPHALGAFGRFDSDIAFWDLFGTKAYTVIATTLSAIAPSAVIICVASLSLLLLWETKAVKQHKVLSRIPAPLLAVSVAAVINELFAMNFPDLALRAEDGHLVSLPVLTGFGSLLQELTHPTWADFLNPKVWTVALTLAAVGSIETLLCIESTDKLDPLRRVSDPNRELMAQGVGNLITGSIGGLPMTSVIVRSSANIYAGARSRLSTILHGTILLISALSLSTWLNHIPLAALAAVLLHVGFKLAHPKLFKATYAEGSNQFVPFLVTILAIMFTDLLRGVFIGLAVGLLFVVKASFHSAIYSVRTGRYLLIKFTKDVTFIHKIALRRRLALIGSNTRVLIDGTRSDLVDHDVKEMLQTFVDAAPLRNISVQLKNVDLNGAGSGHGHAVKPSRKGERDGSVQETAAGK